MAQNQIHTPVFVVCFLGLQETNKMPPAAVNCGFSKHAISWLHFLIIMQISRQPEALLLSLPFARSLISLTN